MSWRISLAHSLLHLGAYIQSMAIMVMKPDDLVAFSRQTYANSKTIEAWAEDTHVDAGLDGEELNLLAAIPEKKGNLLLLGIGGGREAIPLSRMGFRVTGVDYVPAMVERAKENTARRGLCIDGLVQDISDLDVPAGTFDVVWLSKELYSCVPSRLRRVEMVLRIASALKPGGLFLCQFRWNAGPRSQGMGRFFRRLIALFTLGNLTYETGDKLWLNVEFIHFFASEAEIRSELEEGGLRIIEIHASPSQVRGSVVCQKPFLTAGKENVPL